MYSLIPTLVAVLFLGFGVYVIAEKGLNRMTASFLALCLTTFFWQAAWAVLFQMRQDTGLATDLIRFGYLLIVFLPTCLYHFLVEISGFHSERSWVYGSYAFAAVLGFFDLFTNLFVSGYYSYFFGFYPKAGPLHVVHVVQTVAVVMRGLYIAYRASQNTSDDHRQRLRMCMCIVSVLIYFMAAVDYFANYGFEFYPPGIVFITISLGVITWAVTRLNLMAKLEAAATVAHEIRTPLVRIGMQAEHVQQFLPAVLDGYRASVRRGDIAYAVPEQQLVQIEKLMGSISQQVGRCNTVIDMLLASIKADKMDPAGFERHVVSDVVIEALEGFPFPDADRQRIHVEMADDFSFHGSRALLVFVLFNLVKNSLYAIKARGAGDIQLSFSKGKHHNRLLFRDTGEGISANALPQIFDLYFTTKGSSGLGVGLPFCRRVMRAFGGDMVCKSEPGSYTLFILKFPVQDSAPPVERPSQGLRWVSQ
jgi:two-component system CAI-1 autoinducer sensor kinase/phosphatase CqsS